jgi:hypothetical protein
MFSDFVKMSLAATKAVHNPLTLVPCHFLAHHETK